MAEEKFPLKILLAIILSMPLAIMFIVVETRYRFSIYPFLALFGGFACFNLFKKKEGWRLFSLVFCVFLANAVLDLISNKELSMERLKSLIS